MNSGTVNNALYRTRIIIGASRFKQVLWYLTNIVLFNNRLNIFYSLKISLLKAFGAEVGKGVVIKPSVNIKYPWKLKIGEHSWIGEGVWIDNLAQVVIGNNVCISQGALLLCGNHNYKKETFDLILGNIVLEEGVWIGAKAIVCPGITCASHSVVTAGSVVTKSTLPFGIYQGNPAQKVGERIIST